MDKKKAARKAAAKYYDDLTSAVRKYAKSTDRNTPEELFTNFESIKDEMISLLEYYRIPVFHKEDEILIPEYKRPDMLPMLEMCFVGYSEPACIVKLKKLKEDPDLSRLDLGFFDDILEYVKDADIERTKLRLALDKCSERLGDCEERLAGLEPKHQKAWDAYINSPQKKRARNACRELGFRIKKNDHMAAFKNHLVLVRAEGKSRGEAAIAINEACYVDSDIGTVLQYLGAGRRELIKQKKKLMDRWALNLKRSQRK